MNYQRSRTLGRSLAAALLACAPAVPAHADIITDWNAQALAAIRTYDDESPFAARNLAILQTAIYNAVEGIAGQHDLYAAGSYGGPSGTAAAGASMEAAAAAAAYTILSSLYSGSAGNYNTLFSTQLSAMADDQAKIDGINYGMLVANDILNWRAGDGASAAGAPGQYTPVGLAGYWQETPPNYAPAALPGWGNVQTFGIPGTAGYTSSLPGGLSNGNYIQTAAYAADYNQVKDLGAAGSVTRTADQLTSAYFWDAPKGTITPAGIWNEVAQTVAASAGLGLLDTARLFAALNVAMADAGVVAWQDKFSTDFWSPITAINNGDADSNAATDADLLWMPLLDSSNYPGFASEHSAFSSAAAAILAAFLGDAFAFTLGSDIDGNGTHDLIRNFNSFSEARDEAGLSRIYGGVQFAADDQAGQAAGALIAGHILNNYFAPTPVPEPGGAVLVVIGAGLLACIRRRQPAGAAVPNQVFRSDSPGSHRACRLKN